VAAGVWQAWRRLGGRNRLTQLAAGWLALVLAQIGLGMATILSNKAADIATLHVLAGALTLATGALWCVIAFRRPAAVHPEVAGKAGWARQLGGRSAGWETRDTADLEVCGTNNPPTTSGGTGPAGATYFVPDKAISGVLNESGAMAVNK